MALMAAQDASQWAANPHFGYDTSGLFASFGAAPAALLQASNFRVSLFYNPFEDCAVRREYKCAERTSLSYQ